MSRAPEQKSAKILRTIFSFILACVITLLSVSVCFSSSFLVPERLQSYFTGYAYVNGVKCDISDYTKSVYNKDGLDISNIDNIITHDRVYDIINDYTSYSIVGKVGYDDKTYKPQVEVITSELEADIKSQLKEDGIKYDADTLGNVVNNIAKYIDQQARLCYSSKLTAILDIGNKVTKIVIVVSIALLIFVGGVLLFLGDVRYRSMRAISISMLTSGIYQILLGAMVIIISRIKHIDIYPYYLSGALMKYVNNCTQTLMFAGFIIIIVSVIFASLTWVRRSK